MLLVFLLSNATLLALDFQLEQLFLQSLQQHSWAVACGSAGSRSARRRDNGARGQTLNFGGFVFIHALGFHDLGRRALRYVVAAYCERNRESAQDVPAIFF